MPTQFPENEVEVLRSYLPNDLNLKLAAVVKELRRTSVAFITDELTLPPRQIEEHQAARRVNLARQAFSSLFRKAELGQAEKDQDPALAIRKPPAIVAFEAITDDLQRQNFPGAVIRLESFVAAHRPTPLQLDSDTISTALTRTPHVYGVERIVKIIHLDSGDREVTKIEKHTLPGFAGPDLTRADVEQLLTLLSFLSDTPERKYRLGVMEGKARASAGDHAGAIAALGVVRASAVAPLSPRDRFVALQTGEAYLGLGDTLYRGLRPSRSDDLPLIRKAYADAVSVVAAAIAPENPLRQQIEEYAALQLEKLDAELNFVGYRDNYVPILRPETLLGLAERRIKAAQDATQLFEAYLTRFDELAELLRDLDFQTEVKDRELRIADDQIAKTKEQVSIAQRQIDRLDVQIDMLKVSSVVDVGGLILKAATTEDPARKLEAVTGILSAGVNYGARQQDLDFQREIATKELRIARRDASIARLGMKITELAVGALEQRILSIKAGELNPDVYQAAAEALRTLAQRHLDQAIVWAYLFERAVSFLRLEPNLRKIRLDYAKGAASRLTAVQQLAADLNEVVDVNLPVTKFQVLTESYFLRSLFPLEFNAFLQTGRMDFNFSLYELTKARPGVYRQRIKRVQVKLQFPPPSGFTGRIRHRGTFLLRDRDTTPDVGEGTFMPTKERLDQAVATLEAGGAQGVPIGGVMPFLLDVDTIEISPNPPDPEDAAPEALSPIEGYGLAGNWTLEVENVDLRFITDVELIITSVIPESDEALGKRVKGLIAEHERQLSQGEGLDKISPFSLSQSFPDTLAQMTRSGEGRLVVSRNDFPSGIKQLKLKTLIVQSLDDGGKAVEGVALELSRPGSSFRLERTTRADGFSEDVSAEIPVLPRDQRMDVEGAYVVRLLERGRFDGVKDLMLFFLYEFQEA